MFMSLLHAARVRENVLLHARSYRLTVYSSKNSHRHDYKRSRRVTRLLHAARIRENVLLHARSFRLTVYSSENSQRRLAIKVLA